MQVEKFYYDNRTVKWFAYAVLVWAVVGMLAGLWASIALFYPGINLGLPATTFGRMRPVTPTLSFLRSWETVSSWGSIIPYSVFVKRGCTATS